MKLTEKLREEWKKKMFTEILNILENSELTTYDVNRELGVHHITAKKYLVFLEKKKLVNHRKLGGQDLWSLKGVNENVQK